MEDTSLIHWVIWVMWVLVVCSAGGWGQAGGGSELCGAVVVGWRMLVGLEVVGRMRGQRAVLLQEAEEGGGCSWLTRTWSPTCWTSCLLGEEEEEEDGLLGARTWGHFSRGHVGSGGRRMIAVFLQFLWQQICRVLDLLCVVLWAAAEVLVPAAAG